MKKVIVTGANGFVGSALVKELVKNDVEVLAMDMPGCNGNLPVCDKVKFLPLALDNISTLKDLINDRDFDCFYHFAWAGSAGAARADTKLQLQNALLIACVLLKKLAAKNLLQQAASWNTKQWQPLLHLAINRD